MAWMCKNLTEGHQGETNRAEVNRIHEAKNQTMDPLKPKSKIGTADQDGEYPKQVLDKFVSKMSLIQSKKLRTPMMDLLYNITVHN